jgi:hypothetical protein
VENPFKYGGVVRNPFCQDLSPAPSSGASRRKGHVLRLPEIHWHSISGPQKALLEALAKEPDAKLFSREFHLAHGIGPSSSIKASLESLTKKGILQRTKSGGYQF